MVEKLDISKITIDDLNITHDDINIITVAKVGTCNFAKSLNKIWFHGLNNLIDLKLIKKKNLIISGIRNPLDRNISYLFETYNKTICEPTIKNNNGEYNNINNTFICNNFNELLNIETNDLIELFKNKDYIYHNHFTIWFEQFFELTKINDIEFDKEKGLQLYKLNDDTYVLFYTLEKFNDNKNVIEKFLKISLLNNMNSSDNKDIILKYKDFKQKIKLDADYKNRLLNTDVMKCFYSDESIKYFNSLY